MRWKSHVRFGGRAGETDRWQLEPGQPVPFADGGQMRRAQEAVEVAENRLWQLRGELLGWARPPWTPGAALISDWFSEEDAAYDDLPETTAS